MSQSQKENPNKSHIRGCLHSDMELDPKRKASVDKAFKFFNALEKTVSKNLAKHHRKQRGWQ